jgi:hypothetical protein
MIFLYNNNMKKKIELASQDKIIELEPYINKVLRALGHSEALVTDESLISDFLNIFDQKERDKQLKKLIKKLKLKIDDGDYVWKVAEQIKRGK